MTEISDNALLLGHEYGFNAILVIMLLFASGYGLKWFILHYDKVLLNMHEEHKSERQEYRGMLEKQHQEIVTTNKENNLVIGQLARAVDKLAERKRADD